MTLRAAFEATVGRRLLVRIWLHGVLLFAGVLVMVLVARRIMSNVDQAHLVHARPHLATGAAERVLARVDHPDALAREVTRLRREDFLRITVFAADGTLLATSTEPPLPAPEPAERAALTPLAERLTWSAAGYQMVGGFRDGRLVAVAVVALPPPPSIPWHVLALLGAALVLAFVFVAGPLTWSIAHPLERLGALARALGAGDLSVRANSTRRDEIGDLARSFDTMAAQVQRLRAAERELLGDVSHELRTPVARMRVVLDLARDAELERVNRYLGEITTDLGELEQLIDDIIDSARLDPDATRWDPARPPLRPTRITADELVDAAVARFTARWPDRPLEVRRAPAPLAFDGDLSLLRRVLDNLLDNARKYSPDGSPITLAVEPTATGVRIEVQDRGQGIAPADRDRVFTSFFRADRSRTRASGGVGLGLALARRIVLAHGGRIDFDSTPGVGSRFWFEL